MHPETHGAAEAIALVVALPGVDRRALLQRHLAQPVWSVNACSRVTQSRYQG